MREDWIDRWRGLLMLAIVAFHVAGAMISSSTEEAKVVLTSVTDMFATFHTRGFFVIAGLLWRPGLRFRDFLLRKAKRLLVPYFLFGLVWALLFALLGNHFDVLAATDAQTATLPFWKPFLSVLLANGWPEGIGFRVINALWFLPCLFLVETIYFWIDRMIPARSWQLALLPVCFALNSLVFKPDLFWSLNLVPRFMACFIIGRALGRLVGLKVNRLWALSASIILFFIVSQPHIVKSIVKLAGIAGWSDFLRGMCGVIACAMLAQVIRLRLLALFGCATMGVLVTHKAFIMGMQIFRFQFYNPTLTLSILTMMTITVSLISFYVTCIIRKYCKWSLGEFK